MKDLKTPNTRVYTWVKPMEAQTQTEEKKLAPRKSVMVDSEVLRRLWMLRIKHGFKNMNEVIKYLLDKCGEA